MGKFIKDNLFLLTILVVTTVLGIYSKSYSGVFHKTVNNRISDLLYVVFWVILFKIIFPKNSDYKIVLSVFVITCALEFLQLWHPPFLQYIRSFLLGRTLLGTSYMPEDFLYYIMGAAIAYLILLKND